MPGNTIDVSGDREMARAIKKLARLLQKEQNVMVKDAMGKIAIFSSAKTDITNKD